jgi:hypothetical protein
MLLESIKRKIFVKKYKMEKQDIQKYINNFRRLFSSYLKPNVGMQTTVYPFDKGAIIVFELNIDSLNKDEIRAKSIDVQDALKRTNLFEKEKRESLHNFIGTNIILAGNKVVIIKDNNLSEWTLYKLEKDIEKIIKPVES